MYRLRFAAVWLLGGLIIAAIIVHLSLASPTEIVEFSYNDKIAHLAAYAVLMTWWGGIFKGRAQWILVVLFIAMGTILEVLQGLGGVREFSFLDMAMNTAGVLLGVQLCRVGLSGWCQKIEQLVSR